MYPNYSAKQVDILEYVWWGGVGKEGGQIAGSCKRGEMLIGLNVWSVFAQIIIILKISILKVKMQCCPSLNDILLYKNTVSF